MAHADRPGGTRFLTVSIFGLSCLAVLACWWKYGTINQPPEHSFSGNSQNLLRTVIVPILDSPIPNGKSAIWCISFELAWKQFESDVAKGPFSVQGAEELAERLNRAEESVDDTYPEMVYAAAGFNKDGIQEKIRREMQQKFSGVLLPPMDPDLSGATAFAHLKAEVKYNHRFLKNPDRLVFTDGKGAKTGLGSFGIPRSNKEVPAELREQVRVLYVALNETAQVTEFALDLGRHSQPNQVVLARLDRGETLADTLADLERKISRFQASTGGTGIGSEDKFDFNDRLLVPTMHWRMEHHFRELEGKYLIHRQWHDVYWQTAFQSIDFRLDPEGAAVSSSALLEAKSHPPRHYHFDRPFLIYLKKRDAKHPFFVMWVDNAELLCR